MTTHQVPEWESAAAVRRAVREGIAEREKAEVAEIQEFLRRVHEHSEFLARTGSVVSRDALTESAQPKPIRKRWRSRNFFFAHRLLSGLVGGVIPVIFASPYIISNSEADPFGVLRVAAILYALGFGYFFVSPD